VAFALSALLGRGGVSGSALPAYFNLEPAFLGYRALQGIGDWQRASLLGVVLPFSPSERHIYLLVLGVSERYHKIFIGGHSAIGSQHTEKQRSEAVNV